VQEDVDEKIQCKVLDCDTISQVKLKILDALYKNTPYTMRPSIHEIDLEWRHGRGGHLTLQDEDLTTKTVSGWKKINTLAHYGVKESAVMSLIPRQNDSFNSNCKQPCQNCTGSSYFGNAVSPTIPSNGDVESGNHSNNAKVSDLFAIVYALLFCCTHFLCIFDMCEHVRFYFAQKI
jgi:plexin A